MKRYISAAAALALSLSAFGYFPPDTVTAADAVSFTHEEWTGRNGSEDIFAVNREAASVNAVPYQSPEAAAAAVWDYNARSDSDYLQLLTGVGEEWQLNVVQNADEAYPYYTGGFMNADYSPSAADGWKNVTLPDSWTCQGFDFPIYSNIGEPWQVKYDGWGVDVPNAPTKYNPVGLYRKKFTPDSSLTAGGRRVYIQFDGVESAYYVYLNGKAVGYSEDTFSPHRFDITDYLVSGENTLAVEVHKFCDGTWFEDQDMIYDGGIFRDVMLVSAPATQIFDYTVRTDLDDTYTDAVLSVSADIRNISGSAKNGWVLEADIVDESGKSILSAGGAKVGELGAWSTKTIELSETVKSPKLWSAEDPNLYALILTLRDDSNNVQEIVSTQLGFREIGFTSTEVDWAYNVTTKNWQPITINGKRLLLKGVNRHDTDPFHGKAVTQDCMREDITLMKANNINALRTSHYSNDSYLYWLCNKYGIYVMGETNMESHALMDNNDGKALFYELGMDRTETAYKRLKNNPSIVAWSIGNEMAYTSDPNAAGGLFRDMIWYFKKHDPTRPVHSEGQGSKLGVDMGSNMYPGSDVIGYNCGVGKIPYVMCEYDHAMGNSVGALKEYWDVIRSADNMLGGFIWDWADQSRATPLPWDGWDYYSEPYAQKNLYSDEIKGKYYAYGGDWGDFPNDNSFCENGLISPDRNPQPELAEVKYQYQSFWFSASSEQLARGEVSVYNENNFLDLGDFDTSWELLKNGIVIQSGTIKRAYCEPLSSETLYIPYSLPEVRLAGDEFALNISVRTKKATDLLPKGSEAAYAQIPISTTGRTVMDMPSGKEITVVDNPDMYVVVGDTFNFGVSKSYGNILSYVSHGDTLIEHGPTPNFWRGNVENDGNAGRNSLFDTAWETAADDIRVDSIDVTDGADGEKIITVHQSYPDAGSMKSTITYTVSPSGKVQVDISVDATKSGLGSFLRVGSIMRLPEGMEDVMWYGNGPVETFNDRKTNGRAQVWESTVSEMFYPYMKADDTGNLTDVRWISVMDKSKDYGLLIAANGNVEASALHFAPEDLQAADHVYKLKPRSETMLSIDYGSMGTGSATCGQGTLEKYRLPSNRVYEWSYTIIPEPTNTTGDQLTNAAAKIRSQGASIQDKSQNALTVPVSSGASLKTTDSGKAVSGQLSIPSGSGLDKCLSGKNSFTVEVNVVPTGDPEFNMFAGKGDSAFALRTRWNSLDFFVYAGGQWRPLYCEMSTDAASGWIGKMHQVAGIYDAENNTMSLYVDGRMIGSAPTNTTEGVGATGFDLTLGACPDTGRASQADFYDMRVYSKALTAQELASQNTASPAYSASSPYVQLWLDMDNAGSGSLLGDINADGNVNIADLVLLQNYILAKTTLTAAQYSAADVITDSRVDIFDLIGLRRLIVYGTT